MKATISFKALAMTLLIVMGVTYVVCIAVNLLFGWTTLRALAPSLPGVTWPLTIGRFLVGLIWVAACSVYSAALIALPYNHFVQRGRPA